MGKPGQTYTPSNGTEGCFFQDKFCEQCAHEKFTHTQNDGDKKCAILDAAMLYDSSSPEYPAAWTYDENGNPTCTEYKHHTWRDPWTGDLIEYEEPEPIDPDQLDLFA